ncbi:thrombospondin type 3 repeat-containing protein [Candidatus Pyrohabitans sp.]
MEPEGAQNDAGHLHSESRRKKLSRKAAFIVLALAFGLGAIAAGLAHQSNDGIKNYIEKVETAKVEVDRALTNTYEYVFEHEKYKLKRMDSDGDGVSDWEEIQKGTNPYLTPEEEKRKKEQGQIKLKEMLRKEFYDALVEKIGKEDAELILKNDIEYVIEDGLMRRVVYTPLVIADNTTYVKNVSEARKKMKDFIDKNVYEYYHGLDIGDEDKDITILVTNEVIKNVENGTYVDPFETVKSSLEFLNKTCPEEYKDVIKYVRLIEIRYIWEDEKALGLAGYPSDITLHSGLLTKDPSGVYKPEFAVATTILHEAEHNRIGATGLRSKFKSIDEEHEYMKKLNSKCINSMNEEIIKRRYSEKQEEKN